MAWKIDGPQGHEQRKTRWRALPYIRGKGLDLGCGGEKVLDTAHVIGIDSGKDIQLFGTPMKPDILRDVTDLSIFAAGSMDFVFSSHTLEHIEPEKVGATLREWMRVVRVGGHLVLYLPDEQQYPKCREPGRGIEDFESGCNQDHKWNVHYEAVVNLMERTGFGWDLVHYERCDKNDEYSLFFAFKKSKNPNEQKHSWKIDPNPEKKPTAAVIRYGAFGDTIQAASLCATLKKQGYHVTMYATYPASEIVAVDPNIDKLVVYLQDQVPIQWLGHMWMWQRQFYDKWINLTESVETNMLATEMNVRFEWAPAARHAAMNHNYLEFQHKLGRIPYEPSSRFYPTEDEKKWREVERERMRKAGIEKFMIWPLAGSSRTHKIWPHIDQIFGRVLHHYKDWGVVTIGDGSCADLEAGWEGHQRIWRTSGKWTIRQCATMMEWADIVIGPETGLMSISAFYDMPKIVFLSHSTIENLTRDWKNTASLYAPSTQCPGRGKNEAPACHMMLPTFNGCLRNDQYGTAQCTVEIKPEWCWTVLQHCMIEGKAPTQREVDEYIRADSPSIVQSD